MQRLHGVAVIIDRRNSARIDTVLAKSKLSQAYNEERDTARMRSEKNTGCFYSSEILADFQSRLKAAEKEREFGQKDVRQGVGMPTINPKSKAGKYFVELASSSSLHGLNHLVAPNRHPFELFLVVFFIVGALICLILLSCIFWDRYQNNATVIVVDNDQAQFKILKPALFVCPIPNVDRDKIRNVFKKHNVEYTAEAEEFIIHLATLTYENMKETPIFDQIPPSKWLEILYDSRLDIPSNILKEDESQKTWTVTERGLCLALRSVYARYASLSYWTNENRTGASQSEELPYYSYDKNGIQESIAVPSAALISVCDPFEVTTYGTPTKLLKQKTFERTILSMSEIKTKPNVLELSIQQRKCKFSSDGGLKTWPVYTRNACVTECRMKVIEDSCHCRPHFARPIDGLKTCNATQLRCIGGITYKLFLFEYPPPFCGCIPRCNVVSYQIRDSEESELNNTPIDESVMTVVVELPQVIFYRSLLYGFTDFLTSVGGAAGLFLGASVLSFAEIFYYITLRVYFYIKRR